MGKTEANPLPDDKVEGDSGDTDLADLEAGNVRIDEMRPDRRPK